MQNVANAALDDLELDRTKPRTIEILAGVAESSLRVQQDAAVAGARLPIAPGRAAPSEFNDEPVVAIRLFRDESAPDLSTDANCRRAVDLIDNREHSFGVVGVVI